MGNLLSVRTGDEDTLWAVVATVGRRSRIAEVFRSRAQALDDRAWRDQQVSAYADWLDGPVYRVGLSNYDDNRFLFGLGLTWTGLNGWMFDLDADASADQHGGQSVGVRGSVNGRF